MTKRRDLVIAIVAATIVVVLVASVVIAVQSAERNGRKALEDLQLAQLQQLSRVLDGAIGPALTSKVGLSNPLTRQPWTLSPGDANDHAGLEGLQIAQPTARTGYLLVNRDGVITNGTLLTNPGAIGQKEDRPGLDGVLRGKPAVLVVSPNSLLANPGTLAGTSRRVLIRAPSSDVSCSSNSCFG